MNLDGVVYVFFVFLVVSIKADSSRDDCNFCAWETCNPSITGISEKEFDPEKDAAVIWNAIGYIYADKQQIVNVLSGRTKKQRLAIASKYHERNHRHRLKEDVFDTLFGDIRTIMTVLVTPISKFYSMYVERAIKSRDITRLTEIFTILPPCAIDELDKQYKDTYAVDLNKAMAESLEKKYPVKEIVELMLLLAKGKRSLPTDKRESKEWKKRIDDDAKNLEKVLVQDKWEAKNKKFREIFGGRTLPEIQDVIKSYEKLYYDAKKTKLRNLEKDIKNARFETAEGIYMTIVNIARSQPEYFAMRLNSLLAVSNHMWNVDREELNYVVLGRCDIDLGDIKRAYHEKYGFSLYQSIHSKITRTNSDYYNGILDIVKKN